MLHISNFCLLYLSSISNAIIIFVQGQQLPQILIFCSISRTKKTIRVVQRLTTQHFYKLNLNYEENGIAARNAGMNCITGPLCYDIIGIINHTTIYKTGCVCMNYEEKAYCLMMENWHRQQRCACFKYITVSHIIHFLKLSAIVQHFVLQKNLSNSWFPFNIQKVEEYLVFALLLYI